MSLAKRVVGGTSLLTASGVAARLLAFAAAPILTALLGTTSYGVAALLGTVASIGVILSLIGVDMSYARNYFGSDLYDRKSVERFCWTFSAGNTLLLSVGVAVAWYFFAERIGASASLYWLAGLSVIGGAIRIMAETRIRLRSGYVRIAVSKVTGAAFGLGLTLLVAYLWRRDAWALVIGTTAGVFFSIAVLGLPNPGAWRTTPKLRRDERHEVLALGVAGAVSAPMYWVITSADRILVGYFIDEAAVGVYSFAYALAAIGLVLNTAVTLTWFPEVTRIHEEAPEQTRDRVGELWGRMVVGLLVTWLAVTAAGGDTIRLISDEAFHPGADYVPFLAGGCFFYGLASLGNTGLWIDRKMTHNAMWWLAAAPISIAANLALLPSIGAEAAAIVQCGSIGVAAIGIVSTSQRRFPLAIRWAPLFAIGVGLLALGALMGRPWHEAPLASLALKIPIGLAATFAAGWWIAPNWVHAAFAFFRSWNRL